MNRLPFSKSPYTTRISLAANLSQKKHRSSNNPLVTTTSSCVPANVVCRSSQPRLGLAVLLLLVHLLLPSSTAASGVYHLESVTRHLDGDTTSHFGYSVASYIGQSRSFCLVGAPNATDEFDESIRPGAVYRVILEASSTTEDASCNLVPFGTNEFMWNRHNQRTPAVSVSLGASVASATDGPDGVQLGCDPRHIYLSPDANGTSVPIGIGQCGLYTGRSMEYTVVDPCSGQDQGACLAGFSSSVAPGPGAGLTSVAVGMPGSFLGEGNIFLGTYKGTKMLNKVVLKSSPFDLKNMGYNLGYSVVMTRLLPRATDGEDYQGAEHIITASPIWQMNDHRGVVIITNREMNLEQLIYINDTEGHLGSFFGYSLVAGDFNGDGIGDIVVGAPYFSNFTTFASNLGRVYVFYGGSITTAAGVTQYVGNRDGEPAVLSGTDADGRFGHSLAVLGDVDDDGVEDLAVGCPYCGFENNGAVYVFLGQKNGKMSSVPLQIIRASDVPLNPIIPSCPAFIENPAVQIRPFKSFGWSLAGRYDTDNNEVPDLVVGDYESAQISLFRGRVFVWLVEPTWKIECNSTIRWTGVGNRNCGSNCRFNITLKVDVGGLKSFLTRESIVFNVLIDLDSSVKDPQKKRLAIIDSNPASSNTAGFGTRNILNAFRMPTYQTNSKARRSSFQLFQATVEPIYENVKVNVWLPVVFNITIIPREHEGFVPPAKLPWLLHPIRSQRVFLSRELRFNNTACGPDNECIADLYVNLYDMSVMENREIIYFHERVSRRNLTLCIGNKGENAYKARLRLTFPNILDLELPRNLQCIKDTSMVTTEPSQGFSMENRPVGMNNSLICILRDPIGTTHNLPAKYSIQLVAGGAFKDIIKGSTTDELTLRAEVMSGNKDSDLFDNKAALTYTLKAEANVKISSSSMDRTIIDSRNFSVPITPFQKIHTATLGPRVEHIFLVSNKGPSTAETVWINVSIPVRTIDGDHLVYLLDNVRHLVDDGQPVTVSMAPKVVSVDGSVRGECLLPPGTLDPLNLNAVDLKVLAGQSRRPRRDVQQSASKSAKSDLWNSTAPSRPARSLIPTLRANQQEVIQCGVKSRVFGEPVCLVVRCQVTNLKANDAVRVIVQGWLWAETFFRYKVSDAIVYTSATGQIDPITYKVPISGNRNIAPLSIVQNFVFSGVKILVMKQIPIWPIVLGALLGLLALTLIIVAMWRCGFFKRNRISKDDSPAYM